MKNKLHHKDVSAVVYNIEKKNNNKFLRHSYLICHSYLMCIYDILKQ
jgi:hypothetical protein